MTSLEKSSKSQQMCTISWETITTHPWKSSRKSSNTLRVWISKSLVGSSKRSSSGLETLKETELLTFEIEETDRGLVAINPRKISWSIIPPVLFGSSKN